jgi:hypothetical protein
MNINIEYRHKSITFNFDAFAPIIKLNKKYYLLVRDEFVKINKITLSSGTQLSPTVIPNWIPVSFFEIHVDEIKEAIVFDTFKDNTNSKLFMFDGETKNIIIDFELDYKKIIDKPNCPRYLLYKVKNTSEKYSYIIDENDKLVAIEYGKDEDGDNSYYIPIYLIKKAINNQKILSLRFTEKPTKINKLKIKNHKIFNRTLNNNINVDTYLLLEGELNKELKVEYKDKKVNLEYYEIESINDIILTKEIKDKSLGKIQLINLLNDHLVS